MTENNAIVPIGAIQGSILQIRGQRVIIDSDLAKLYGATTTRLNQQVNRNRHRFPDDFMFQLSPQEKDEVVANCNNLHKLKYYRGLPFAFTEHGAIMAANVLNSEQAINISVLVVRAFVKLREIVGAHEELARKVDELDRRLDSHDDVILKILETIKLLMEPLPPEPKRTLIGFDAEKENR